MLMKLTVSGITFTVGDKTFTVGDETYIGTHRTAPISFMANCKSYTTNCKSDTADCKFCQNLQSVTVAVNAIQLTITRGAIEIKPSTPWGVIENRNFWFQSPPPPGHTSAGGGGWLKTFHRVRRCATNVMEINTTSTSTWIVFDDKLSGRILQTKIAI